MPKRRQTRPPPRTGAPAAPVEPPPSSSPYPAPSSATDASTVASCHHCKEYQLATASPLVALKVLAAAPPMQFVCAIEAIGVLMGQPVFTPDAPRLIKAGAVDAIERSVRARAIDYTVVAGVSRLISTLFRLATLVGNAIRHHGHTCGFQPPKGLERAELVAMAARVRAMTLAILRGMDPDRLKGQELIEPGGWLRVPIEQNGRCSFAAWIIIMLEPELGLREELTDADRVKVARVLAYNIVNGDKFDCVDNSFRALSSIDRMRQHSSSPSSFSLHAALFGSDAEMVDRLSDAAHSHSQHVRASPRPADEKCMRAAQALVDTVDLLVCSSSFGLPMIERWLDKGIIDDVVHVAREATRVHDHGSTTFFTRRPACYPQQCAVDVIASVLQRAYGSGRSAEVARTVVDGDYLQVLVCVGPAMQRQAGLQTTCDHDDEPNTGPNAMLPEGVHPTLIALASIIRERDDADLRRACAFRLRPTIYPAVQRLQTAAAASPDDAASYQIGIQAWRGLAELLGVREERRCGEPSCRSKPTRMKACSACGNSIYCVCSPTPGLC